VWVYYGLFFNNDRLLQCPFRLILNLKCAFCGTQHAIFEFLHLNICQSIDANPLGIVVVIALFAALFVNKAEKLITHIIKPQMIGLAMLLFLILSYLKNQ
jgi:hypothetical protein